MRNSRQELVCRSNPRPPRHERAFSLYDALVTLAVVGAVSVVAVPSFQKLVSNLRMAGATNTLVAALHLARSETIKRAEKAVLCPSSDGRSCHNNVTGSSAWEEGYLLFIDRNDNHKLDADDQVVRLFGATEGLHIRSSAQRDHVTYLPNGMASGTNITFRFCDKHGRSSPRAVIVSNSGRPRTSARDANGGVIACPTAP